MSEQHLILSTFREAICQSLGLSIDTISTTDNLFELGVDSMLMMRMVNQCRRAGCKLTLKEIYQNPTLAQIGELIQSKLTGNLTGNAGAVSEQRQPDLLPTMKEGIPFAMTPVQLAYYVGRDPQQALGGNGCHLYQEFNGLGLEISALEQALNQLRLRHPMLCVHFHNDGTQCWKAPNAPYHITVHDLRHLTDDDAEQAMLTLREQLSHQVLDVEHGQTFDFQIALLTHERQRLYVSIDLLVMDASSFSLFFNELSLLLQNQTLPTHTSDYDFCSYLQQEQQEFAAQKKAANAFWQTQSPLLPPAPNLPLVQDPSLVKKPTFHRRKHWLNPTQWQQLQTLCAANQVTPTMTLATLFAAVLSRWSGQSQLLLNLTLFDCHPFNQHVQQMLADFTNILLLPTEINQASLAELCQTQQQRFAEIYEHRFVSGVEVLRELKRHGSHPYGAPIVFTSNLNHSLFGDDTHSPLGELGWGISQTPQVWLDFVAFKQGDGVALQWDGVDELFAQGLLDTLFSAFIQLVEHTLQGQAAWRSPLPDLLPTSQRQIRAERNQTSSEPPQGLLHQRIFEQAQANPSNTALITAEQILSYNDLVSQAKRLAQTLLNAGMQSGEHVAISMEKGVGQIVAVLAILHAGGVYVPIAPNQPLSRRQTIEESANVRIVLRCETCAQKFAWSSATHIDWQTHGDIALETSPYSRQPEQAAYIIYTSGSTGTPKGVVVSHQSALNTCLDINQRHRVCHTDRIFAVAALHFDLSVYDIFGVLSAGGALVLPKEQQTRDPMAWNSLVTQHSVTLWNSVPALFDMFLTFCEGMKFNTPQQLRTVMLSGDWIDLSLPGRYRSFRPLGTFSAMGGATEAAIWSNEYLVNHVEPHWRSIPYGYPLTNQAYRVVDEAGRDCPDWVQGELWIGGLGVAQGYWNDEPRTATQFVHAVCPDSHQIQRWYRTGDMGCYWPDGTLEFLGRKDNQVKVGGHRIELGEIDAALNRIQGVRHGVTLATELAGSRDKQLECVVVLEGTTLCSQLKSDPRLPQDYATLFEMQPNTDIEDTGSQVADFLSWHLLQTLPNSLQAQPLAKLAQSYGVCAPYLELFKQWWQLLCSRGYATTEQQGAEHYYQLVSQSSAQPKTSALCTNFSQVSPLLQQIITGQADPSVILETDLAPEVMLFKTPAFQALLSNTIKAISSLAEQLCRPIVLIETEARSGLLAQHICSALGPEKVHYYALDSSLSFTQRAAQRLQRFSHVTIQHGSLTHLDTLAGQADVVLLNNMLHRQTNPIDYLQHITRLLKPEGMLLVNEMASLPEASLISAQVLQQAPTLLSAQQLATHFALAKLHVQHSLLAAEQRLYVLRNQHVLLSPDSSQLSAKLSSLIPAYMVPKRFTFVESLPLTTNGKVDRKALMESTRDTHRQEEQSQPIRTTKEQIVAQVWQALFHRSDLQADSDFFLIGGDSLLATRCMGELRKQGYQADLTALFSHSTLSQFAASLIEMTADESSPLAPLIAQPSRRFLPFPMTEVQQAYWVGRQSGFALGEIRSQFFIEFRVEQLDVERFNQAMNRLIQRHDMLRAVVRDHQQQVLIQVPAFTLTCHLLDDIDGFQANALRDALAHQVKNSALWPLFTVEAVSASHGEARIFVNLDNMMLDGLSMQIFFSELQALYHNPDLALPELAITFRDYVEWQQQAVTEQTRAAAKKYWLQRLADLPAPPALPLQSDPNQIHKPKFIRAAGSLSPQEWQALKKLAARHQVTPSALLINAYASVLSAWSDQQALTLNLTLFDRPDVHPNIGQIMGDFTTLLLLAWHPDQHWLASLQRLQHQLVNDLKHSQVSAVWVMRELARQQQRTSATMPVVFTSALGTSERDFLSDSGWLKPVGGLSQTPQVWLDHQVYESSGQLCLNWDAVGELLPQPLLEKMFNQYLTLLQTLATQPESWSRPLNLLVPAPQGVSRLIPSPSKLDNYAAILPPVGGDPVTILTIREQFQQIVNVPISERENFFDAGANSLQLVQLHAALHSLAMPLSVTDLFAYPSPALLAAWLSKAEKVDSSNETLKSRQQRVSDRKANRRQRVTSSPHIA
ncbi:non-ribosomal peptide synthetase [Vibrio cholerae]|nr:non-ribosomal peptide synthetase [Vibrio cholerae]EFH74720.1 yersiniabactin non-ribosomal peptide synthetase [Vibrio cholerae RC385]EKF9421679.1 non-ribosomal peptide synthetase [Vibrio cholerae]